MENVDCDIVARGLPSAYAKETSKLMNILNQKLQCKLNNSTLKSLRALNGNLNEFTCAYVFTFHSKEHKENFMAAVDTFRKYKVIKFEDIFDQYRGTYAGLTISFKNALTKAQREIFAAALEAKRQKKIEIVWEREGKIWMKKNSGRRTVEAKSLEDVKKLAAS